METYFGAFYKLLLRHLKAMGSSKPILTVDDFKSYYTNLAHANEYKSNHVIRITNVSMFTLATALNYVQFNFENSNLHDKIFLSSY